MKRAFVTGADRGLGFALTELLLKDGWTVFAGQYMPQWTGLTELKGLYGEKLCLAPLDVGSDESVDAALKIVAEKTDALELIINNAAVMPSTMVKADGPITDRTGDGTIFERPNTDVFLKVYNINSLGTLRVSNRFIPLLIEGEGDKTLVNISSEAGSMTDQWTARDYQIGYCMSKAAVNMQSIIIQNSLKQYGVKVLIINPGGMMSYIMSGLLRKDEGLVKPEDSAKGIYKLIQEKRDLDGDMYFHYHGKKLTW